MITRKEKLLVRPFQHRNYIQHRQKVMTALPRIDDLTPPKRNHVHIKCKKIQTEAERHAQIERDNFILLRHLNDIMHLKRVDNCWLYEHPKFLQRIKLFHHSSTMPLVDAAESVEFPKMGTKKERCIACHPENYVKKEKIPEERIPFEMKPIREFHSANVFERRREKVLIREKSQPILSTDRSELLKLSSAKTLKTHRKQSPNKIRSSTAHTFQKSSIKRKLKPSSSQDRFQVQALTVIIKFPTKSQVTLNAGISDQIT